MKKYDTEKKKIKFLRRQGSIVTFKTPFNWNGGKHSQIMVTNLERTRKGDVRIIGFSKDTPWFNDMSDLINAVNWEWMEKNH